jgi:hypothetical protein
MDAVRRGPGRDFVDPGQKFCVLRRRHVRGISSFVRPVSVGSNARHVPWGPPRNLGT